MASFYVTHHKFPSNPQLFTVTLNKVASLGGEDNPNFSPRLPSAEEYWKVFVYTSGLDSGGDAVGPVVGGVGGSQDTVNEFIETTIAELCALIDWSQQGEYFPRTDDGAPLVVEQYPGAGQVDVSINSPVVIRVQDPLPGTGIDPSTVSMTIDGFNVVPNVVGNKYDYTFSFSPKPLYNE